MANCSGASRADQKIGVFDSGVGGLTVLSEVIRQLPGESIIYFGDTARLPYGERSPAEILGFVREIITWMISQGVKMVVMACNTSSALALDKVRREFDIPILGIILPGARAAIAGRRIGVICTPATAASNAYRRAILEINPSAQVFQVGCQPFVPLIEQNRIYDPHTVRVAREYLTPLIEAKIDTLVYGCTHYPHLAPIIAQILPPHIRRINPAVHLVNAMAQELDVLALRQQRYLREATAALGCSLDGLEHRLDSVPVKFPGQLPVEFYVSGSPSQFADLAAQWLPAPPQVNAVSLEVLAAGAAVQMSA